MNPGPAEEVGKVAAGFMESMKSQPLALALVVMNLALLAVLYYVAVTSAATREREINMLYAEQKEVRTMLASCVVPPKQP